VLLKSSQGYPPLGFIVGSVPERVKALEFNIGLLVFCAPSGYEGHSSSDFGPQGAPDRARASGAKAES
jgi:hypothetical protein